MAQSIDVYNVYASRVALHLTQRACARACGISLTQLANIEQGKHGTTEKTLRKLCRVLQVPRRRLLEEDEDAPWYL